MSQHSALLSLTATYTDSEDEAETEAESSVSSVQILGKTSAGNSPQKESASEPLIHFNESQKVSKQSSQQSSLGLVSYQDDLIDDDAIDDVYTSDSNPAQEEQAEEETKLTMAISDRAIIENENVIKNGETEVETVNLEEGESASKKPSLIPPEPPGKCPPELQEKFSKMYEKKMKRGLNMNLAIQNNKNFRNPSIYEKLIKYCDIDELGSNYPRDVFDPHEWHESSYYDELAKAQKELMEKRERDRKDRTKVDFVSATVKKLSNSQEPELKRKSKWDQRGVMPPLLLAPSFSQPPPPGVVPPFTNSASGTKSTVISAFGNINKKSK